jgi:hypothetical protein
MSATHKEDAEYKRKVNAVSSRVKDTLRSKATASRKRVVELAERDKECDMQGEMLVEEYGRITLFKKFLTGFLKTRTLDLPSAHPFVRSVKLRYREAAKAHHVFVDKTIDTAALVLDTKWMKAQDDYIMRLSKEQIFDLYGYTYNGDVFVNNYLRGTFDVAQFSNYLETFDIAKPNYFALFFPAMRVLKRFGKIPDMIRMIFNETPTDIDVDQINAIINSDSNVIKYMKLVVIAPKLSYDRFWIPVLEDYIAALEAIVSKAPPAPKAMVLYRGVESDYFLTNFMKDHKARVHIANSFVSTSASVAVANDFMNYENKCCFIRLYVPAGTRMIMMMGISRFDEAEFLLGHKTQFYITKARTEKFCKGTFDLEMRTTSVVVI